MLNEEGYDPEDCRALSDVVSRIGDRWTILIVGHLAAGPQRFNQLRRAIAGITQRMLTLTLRGLERDGLLLRTAHNTTPPAVEYALTERGKTLLTPILMLAKWGREHRPGIVQSRLDFDRSQAADIRQAELSGIVRLSSRVP